MEGGAEVERPRREGEHLRAVVQRVSAAQVVADGEIVGEVGRGLCVLLGVATDDNEALAERLAGKVARLRIFENEEGRFDRSVLDVHGGALVVSQFTLIADTPRATGPSFAGRRRRSRRERALRGVLRVARRATGSTWPEGASGRAWSSSSPTRARSRSSSMQTPRIRRERTGRCYPDRDISYGFGNGRAAPIFCEKELECRFTRRNDNFSTRSLRPSRAGCPTSRFWPPS